MDWRPIEGAGRPQHNDFSCPSNNNKRRIELVDGDSTHVYGVSPGGRLMDRPKRPRTENYACEAAFRAKPDDEFTVAERPFPDQPMFLVLKENGISRQSTPDSAHMERTASGHSIRPDPTEHRSAATELLEDDEAAARVREHVATFRRRFPDSKHERILRSIITPRGYTYGDPAMEASYPLDNNALESIFSAANEVFFNGRLSQRVAWDWSHASSAQYDSRVIGTTALRRAVNHNHAHAVGSAHAHHHHHHGGHLERRGFETLIVLSAPILRDPRYSRRLLISTFLHELIHCYMFICCGFRARDCGGHTRGFQTIAQIVDDWVGPEAGLHLSKMEAELGLFHVSRPSSPGRGDDGAFDDDNDADEDRDCPGEDCEWRSWTPQPVYYEGPDSPPPMQQHSHRQCDNVFPCSGFINITEQKQQKKQLLEMQLQMEPRNRPSYKVPTHQQSTRMRWRHRAARSPYGSEDDCASPIRY